jgi:hypothetical protein
LADLYVDQYDAWCRNDGNHYTGKLGHVNWNAELIWKMKAEQAFNWDVLEDQIPEIFEALSSDIVGSLRQFGLLVNGEFYSLLCQPVVILIWVVLITMRNAFRACQVACIRIDD